VVVETVVAPDVTGESSAPIEPIVAPTPAPTTSQRLSALSENERLEWRKTGALPEIPPAAATQAAEPVEQAAPTGALPPAGSAPVKAKGAEGRKAELAAEIAGLLEQRSKLRQEITAATSTPRAVSSPATADPEPDINTYNDTNGGLSKYLRDQAAWSTREALRARDSELATQTAAARHNAEIQQLEQAWNDRMTTAKTKHADFDSDLVGKLIPPKSLVDAWINEQELDIAADVLYHFQTHPTEVTRILQLPMTRQVRELVLVEQQATKAPVIKRLTDAPNTGPTLGVRATDTTDETVRARKNKDVRGYINAANSRDLAAHKGS